MIIYFSIARTLTRNELKFRLARLCLGATIYVLWRERNKKMFANAEADDVGWFKMIKLLVRDKAVEFSKISRSAENEAIADRWGLPRCMFKQWLGGAGRGPRETLFSNVCFALQGLFGWRLKANRIWILVVNLVLLYGLWLLFPKLLGCTLLPSAEDPVLLLEKVWSSSSFRSCSFREGSPCFLAKLGAFFYFLNWYGLVSFREFYDFYVLPGVFLRLCS